MKYFDEILQAITNRKPLEGFISIFRSYPVGEHMGEGIKGVGNAHNTLYSLLLRRPPDMKEILARNHIYLQGKSTMVFAKDCPLLGLLYEYHPLIYYFRCLKGNGITDSAISNVQSGFTADMNVLMFYMNGSQHD